MNEEYQVLVLGAKSVGKQSLLFRFVHNFWGGEAFEYLGGGDAEDTMWRDGLVDGIGPLRWHIRRSALDDSDCDAKIARTGAVGPSQCFFVLAFSDRASFEVLKLAVARLVSVLKVPISDLTMVIASMQCDRDRDQMVPNEVAIQFARAISASWVETSSKTPLNVEATFEIGVKMCRIKRDSVERQGSCSMQ